LTDGNLLANITKLEHNTIYYAAQKTACCESEERTPVTILLDGLPSPTAQSPQTICGGKIVTLADLIITGVGIKWYDAPVLGNELLPSESVSSGKYYASQNVEDCESPRTEIEIINECYSPYGTIFPFVHTGNATFDKQFVTTAKLYLAPPAGTLDKIGYVRKQIPIKETTVEYYNCTTDPAIIGAPKNPGTMGATNNPGLPIQWNSIGITKPGMSNSIKLTATDKCPTTPIGRYTFDGIAPGTYVLEIARQGFLTRYGVITVSSSSYLGHRELLAGDVNSDITMNAKDLSAISPKQGAYNTSNYAWKYDTNGDKNTSKQDVQIIQINLNAYITIYEETDRWINY
jgi:hypothetical protein